MVCLKDGGYKCAISDKKNRASMFEFSGWILASILTFLMGLICVYCRSARRTGRLKAKKYTDYSKLHFDDFDDKTLLHHCAEVLYYIYNEFCILHCSRSHGWYCFLRGMKCSKEHKLSHSSFSSQVHRYTTKDLVFPLQRYCIWLLMR